MDDKGQVSVDYIVGLALFLFGVFAIFYLSTSIVSPISEKSNEKQLIAESLSDFLLINLSAGESNTVNLTSTEDLLSKSYDNFTQEAGFSGMDYQVNVTVETVNGVRIGNVGNSVPDYSDLGYSKRFVVCNELNEPMVMEVYVW
ncbi:MAG: hypothetical protein ACLFVI_01630 [Archaeoglobaceae archaeon]